MDFSNRGAGAQTAPTPAPAAAKKSSKNDNSKWGRFGIVAAVAAIVILVVAMTIVVATSNKEDTSEAGLVDTSKLQAVFLNTGQVYFGNIDTLNSKYFVVSNIYYLQTSNNGTTAAQQNANTSVSLVKLGCELHEPYDKMVINRDQVTFWENLQDGGQVATAVKTFEKQNPNGQKCADQSSSAGTNSVNSTQNAGSGNGNSTGTTNNNSSNNP